MYILIFDLIHSASICPGEAYLFGTENLTEPGTYTKTFSSVNGCDSTVELSLQRLESPHLDIKVVICEESSYTYNGDELTEAGDYPYTFPAANGCDSIVNISLEKLPINTTTTTFEICEGDRFVIGEEQISSPGTYIGVLSSSSGCDSIINYNLTVFDVFDSTAVMEICEGENYFFQGSFYDKTGIYTKTYVAESGCDSIYTLDLEVLPISYIQKDTLLCEGDVFFFGGERIIENGSYTQFDKNSLGCDSITFLDVEILPTFGLTATGGPICLNDTVHLQAIGGGVFYEWSPAEGLSCTDCPNPVASPKETTDYTVRSLGCLNKELEATIRVEVYEVPKVDLGEDKVIRFGESISIFPEISDFYGDEIEWKRNGEIMDCPAGCLENMRPTEDVTYSVRLKNALGCYVEDSVNIKVKIECTIDDFFIPNTISPNGDGHNDQFYIESYSAATLDYLRIYNRWGEMVFEIKEFGEFWDGSYKGKLAQAGDVFVVLMKVTCPNKKPIIYEGNLTVIK